MVDISACNKSFQANVTDHACNSNTTGNPEWVKPEFNASVENIIIAIVLTALDIVTIFGNLIVLVSFKVDSRLLQPFNIFIFNLAVTDFLVAITAMTFYTLDTLLGYWPFGGIMCGLWIYFDFAMTFASVFTLVAISVDRFWSVTWAVHYKVNNSKKKTIVVVAIIWLCVIAIWTPPFIGDRLKHNVDHYCIWEPSDNREFVIFVAIVGHYIPCGIMVFCYIKVLMVMRRQSAIVAANQPRLGRPTHMQSFASSSINPNPSNINRNTTSFVQSECTNGNDTTADNGNDFDQRRLHSNNSNSNSREKRIFITLTYVLGSYLICWFPFYIAFDTFAWKPELVPDKLYTFFFWMTYVNSTLNPFIYAYTSKDFRSAFLKVLKMFICKNDA